MRFSALLTYLPESKGGRKIPVVDGSRATLKFEMMKGEFLAAVTFEEVQMAFAGDSVKAVLTLVDRGLSTDGIYVGLDFEFYESGVLNGHGTITHLK